MHKDPLIEADYINYDYLEAKSVPVHQKSRPVPSLIERLFCTCAIQKREIMTETNFNFT